MNGRTIAPRQWREVVTAIAVARGVDPAEVLEKKCRTGEVVSVRRIAIGYFRDRGYGQSQVARVSGMHKSSITTAWSPEAAARKNQKSITYMEQRREQVAQGPQA